jgi:hypothetical protein
MPVDASEVARARSSAALKPERFSDFLDYTVTSVGRRGILSRRTILPTPTIQMSPCAMLTSSSLPSNFEPISDNNDRQLLNP